MFVVRRCGARLGFRLIEYRAMRTPANQAFIYKDGALIGPTLYFVRRRRLLAAKRLGTKLTSPRLNKGVARIAKRHRDAKGEGAGKGAFKGRLSPSLRGILNFLAGYFERKIDIVFVLSLDPPRRKIRGIQLLIGVNYISSMFLTGLNVIERRRSRNE